MLNRGGFSLKGVTFNGKDPPEALSADDTNINVAGMKCVSKVAEIFDLARLHLSQLQ